MGILALTLWTATQKGLFDGCLRGCTSCTHRNSRSISGSRRFVPYHGGGHGRRRLPHLSNHGPSDGPPEPIHGFAAETAAVTVIQVASHWGIPLLTMYVIPASILGVGATRRLSAVKWRVVGRMVWAWVMTLPATALIGYLLECLLRSSRLASSSASSLLKGPSRANLAD